MRAGEVIKPRCTLAYAAPEVVAAVSESRPLEVAPSHDVWAVGMLAYEAIVQRTTMAAMGDILDCAYGRRPYPWEAPADAQPPAWRQSRLRALLAPCLARDAAQRPTAAALLASISRMGHATTTMRA